MVWLRSLRSHLSSQLALRKPLMRRSFCQRGEDHQDDPAHCRDAQEKIQQSYCVRLRKLSFRGNDKREKVQRYSNTKQKNDFHGLSESVTVIHVFTPSGAKRPKSGLCPFHITPYPAAYVAIPGNVPHLALSSLGLGNGECLSLKFLAADEANYGLTSRNIPKPMMPIPKIGRTMAANKQGQKLR